MSEESSYTPEEHSYIPKKGSYIPAEGAWLYSVKGQLHDKEAQLYGIMILTYTHMEQSFWSGGRDNTKGVRTPFIMPQWFSFYCIKKYISKVLYDLMPILILFLMK